MYKNEIPSFDFGDILMKNVIKTALTMVAVCTAVTAAPISSFSDLDTATVDETFTKDTTFSTPSDIKNNSFIMDFTMTTPGSFATNGGVLVDLGADAKGVSLVMVDDRLVFRANNSGNLYTTSTALSASTSYRVTGSIFINGSGDDEMRLYLDESYAVDASFDSGTNHKPTVATLGDVQGGNDSGFGVVGGGIVLGGTAASPGKLGGPNEIAFTGTMDSDLDMYYGSHLTVAIPEPSTLILLGIGLGSVVLFRRKR